jgi:hypothetical protein
MNKIDLSLTPEQRAKLRAEYDRLHRGRSMTYTMRWGAGREGDEEFKAKQKAHWSFDRVVLLRMRTIKWQLEAADAAEDERLRAHDRVDSLVYALEGLSRAARR